MKEVKEELKSRDIIPCSQIRRLIIVKVSVLPMNIQGNPLGLTGLISLLRGDSQVFHPWVGKIPWRRAGQPTPVFLPEESWTEEPGRLQSMGSQRVGHD